MERIFEGIEKMPNFKQQLKLWCRVNNVRVSFTIEVTLSKAKSIHKKNQSSLRKSDALGKGRWLENELKLFYFIVLALSALSKVRISEFSDEEWKVLQDAFPSKPLACIKFEAASFILDKKKLKQKWEPEEDLLLKKIISRLSAEKRWNDIAVQLFVESEEKIFRLGKQCRERWLNHLDDSIKHEKWTEEEDRELIRNVLFYGKKWSLIMKNLHNHRTEHMIKNRYISLFLKYKKKNPLIEDEELILKEICAEMKIDVSTPPNEEGISRRLRNKEKASSNQSRKSMQNMSKDYSLEEMKVKIEEEHLSPVSRPHESFPQNIGGERKEAESCTIIVGSPATSCNFYSTSKVGQFVPCNNLYETFNYFPLYFTGFMGMPY